MNVKATIRMVMFLLGMFSFTITAKAQAPTYLLTISNETQINDRTYQFDVYLKNTSANTFELANVGFGIAYDTSILMGGTPTCSVISGFSDLNIAQIPTAGATTTGANIYTITINGVNVVCRYFNIPAKANPGAGSGTTISATGTCPTPGTRVCRLQIANTVPFRASSTCKHTFSSAPGTQKTNTVVSAYVTGIATAITSQTSHLAYATTTTASSTAFTTAASAGSCTQNIKLNDCPTAGTLSGTQSICSDGTTTFSSTQTGGTWSTSDAAVATIDASTGVVTGVSAGTATMTYTIAASGSCGAATATRTVTVTAAPSAGTLSGTDVICSTSSTTFASTIIGGTWSSGNTAVATINPTSGAITPVSTGTATMTYTVTGTGGCTNATATRDVTITAGPVAGTLSGTQSICTSGGTSTSTFTSTSAGGTWSSGNTSVATIDASTGVITPIAVGTATMTYTVAGVGCPDATATRDITVTAAPTAGTLSGTQAVCTNSTGISFASTVSGGAWSSGTTAVATINGSTGAITILTPGTSTMTYTVTGTGGCENATATLDLTVTQGPLAGSLDGTQSICTSGGTNTTTFTSSVTGGTWSSGNTSVATIDASTGVITPLAAGTATMTYTVSSAGCPDATATRTVTVTAAPNAGTVSGTQAICSSTTTTFTTTGSGGTWSSSTPSVATVNSTSGLVVGLAAGTSTITYTVIGTGGCSNATATRDVTVTLAPTAGTLSGINAICTSGGTSTTTFVSTVSGGTWSSGNTSVATIDASTGVITPIAAGSSIITYTVLGTGGCNNATATRTVTVTAAPNAGTLSGNQAVCTGLTTTFSSTVTGGSWSSSALSIATINSSTGVVTGVAAGTATMTYTKVGTGGCSNATDTRTVTVTTAPVAGTLSGTATICSNGTTTLASTISGGTWSSATTSVATVDPTSGVVSGVAAGTSVITYTVAGTGGCNNATATRTVTVTAAPVAGTLSGNQNICSNQTTTFTSTSTGGTWASGNTSIATINATTGVVTPFSGTVSGTVTMTYTKTGTGGCTNATATRDVTITAAPTVGSITGTLTLCSNGTTTLSSTVTGGSWISSNTNVATINASSGVVTGVAAGTATMTYTVTGTGGCSNATGQRTVTVTAAPNAGTLSGNQAICANGSTTFTTTATGGTWSSGNTAVATINSSTGAITTVSAGTATMTYTVVGTGGCNNATATRDVTITAQPNAGTISGTTAICSNGSTTLSTTGTGGTWSSDNTSVASIDANTGTVTGASAGTTTITYTVVGTGGCTNATTTSTVTVTAAPNAGTISGTTAICSNGSTTLSTTGIGGTWSSDNLSVATINTTTGAVTGVSAGTATMTYTVVGTGGCTNATATSTITVTAQPNAGTLSGTQAICSNGTSIFSTSGSGGTWSSSNTSIATINASTGEITPVAAGTATMTYTVVGTGGCTNATATRIATITQEPSSGRLSGTQTVCSNATTTFSSDVVGGTWSSGNTAIATINSSGVITPVSAGIATITYTVTGTGGCADAFDTRDVTVNAAPAAIINNISGTTEITCGRPSIDVSADGGVSYSWSNGSTVVSTIADLNATAAGTYTVSVTSAEGCIDTESIVITSNTTLPGATITNNTGTTVLTCTTTAIAVTASGNGTFSWDNGGFGSSSTASIITPDTYILTVTGANDCISTASITITENTTPPTAAITNNTGSEEITCSTTAISVTGTGGTSYSWSDGLGNNASASITLPGTYTVTVTAANGCTSTADVTIGENVTRPDVEEVVGSGAVCQNATTVYANITLGGVWSSSNTSIATVSTTGTVTGVAAGTTAINYTVTNATNGCSTVKSFDVTVTANSLAGAGVDQVIGTTETAILNGSLTGDATSAVWTTSGTGSFQPNNNTLNATYVPSPADVIAGSVTLTLTPVGGTCSNTADNMLLTITTTTPITQVNLSGYRDGKVNQLRWVTTLEANNYGFELQRSVDGIRYTNIGFVNTLANGGNSTSSLNYSFTDISAMNSVNYYRLRQIDNDGRSRFSNVVVIKDGKAGMTITGLYPNPAASVVNVVIATPAATKATLLISDVAGRAITQRAVTLNEGANTTTFNISNFAAGTYTIKMITTSGEVSTVKFVKQ